MLDSRYSMLDLEKRRRMSVRIEHLESGDAKI